MNRPVIPTIREKYNILHTHGPAMELTTMIGCPLMCTFCPQKNLRNSYGKSAKYMSVGTLTTVLDKLPTNTRIDFSGMSEPWANPNCTDMLEQTLVRGFKVAIFSTLYGMKKEDASRTKELLEKYERQIEIVCVHLPDANKNMVGWKYSKEWKECFEIISNTRVSCGVGAMTMDGSGRVHPDIANIARISYHAELHTRADSLDVSQIGTQPIKATPKHTNPLTCRSTPFFDRNVLLPNGDVVLCCMDYNLKHIIGNLLTQNYEDIFKNKALLDLIKINETAGFSKCSICKSCDNVTYIAP
jgi:hypothetical protein